MVLADYALTTTMTVPKAPWLTVQLTEAQGPFEAIIIITYISV